LLLVPPESDDADELKKTQLKELAILNGTYKENKTLQAVPNRRANPPMQQGHGNGFFPAEAMNMLQQQQRMMMHQRTMMQQQQATFMANNSSAHMYPPAAGGNFGSNGRFNQNMAGNFPAGGHQRFAMNQQRPPFNMNMGPNSMRAPNMTFNRAGSSGQGHDTHALTAKGRSVSSAVDAAPFVPPGQEQMDRLRLWVPPGGIESEAPDRASSASAQASRLAPARTFSAPNGVAGTPLKGIVSGKEETSPCYLMSIPDTPQSQDGGSGGRCCLQGENDIAAPRFDQIDLGMENYFRGSAAGPVPGRVPFGVSASVNSSTGSVGVSQKGDAGGLVRRRSSPPAGIKARFQPYARSLQEQLDISQLAFSAPQAPAVGAGDGAGGRYSLF
jgi:hypothetical protein